MKILSVLVLFAFILLTGILVAGDPLHRDLRDESDDENGKQLPVGTGEQGKPDEKLTKTLSQADNSQNGTKRNDSKNANSGLGSYLRPFEASSDVVKRMLYVLLGVTAIVIVYFVYRAIRLRRRRSKSKKYGVLTTPGGEMEMAPLDQDEEEDDMTVFDANSTK